MVQRLVDVEHIVRPAHIVGADVQDDTRIENAFDDVTGSLCNATFYLLSVYPSTKFRSNFFFCFTSIVVCPELQNLAGIFSNKGSENYTFLRNLSHERESHDQEPELVRRESGVEVIYYYT